jgi:hypothetical protein
MVALWNAAAPEVRTLMLAQLRAWAEVKGRMPSESRTPASTAEIRREA